MREAERDGPDISVLLVTYNRSDMLERTVHFLRERADLDGLIVEYVITDDASEPAHLDRVLSLAADTHVTSPVNRGLGHNCNKGIAACAGKLIFQLQDDWEFLGPADVLKTAMRILDADPEIGVVQLIDAVPDLPHELRTLADGIAYRVFANDGLSQRRPSGARPYSDQPHVKHRQFIHDIGPYQEGVPMADMELDYQRAVACQTRWRVASLPGVSAFAHLGADQSFNTSTLRNQRLARLERTPIVGPLFRVVRPALRRFKAMLD